MMKFSLIFAFLVVTIFDQFHIASCNPAFSTFLAVLQSKVGEQVATNLGDYFVINPQRIPENILNPQCEEVEVKLYKFITNSTRSSGSTRRISASPIQTTLFHDLPRISQGFSDIHSLIIREPTIEDVDAQITDNFEELLVNLHRRTIDRSFLTDLREIKTQIARGYNDIARRLIARMNAVSAVRAEYMNLALPHMDALSLPTVDLLERTLHEPKSRLLPALQETVQLAHEFNDFRIESAISIMEIE